MHGYISGLLILLHLSVFMPVLYYSLDDYSFIVQLEIRRCDDFVLGSRQLYLPIFKLECQWNFFQLSPALLVRCNWKTIHMGGRTRSQLLDYS